MKGQPMKLKKSTYLIALLMAFGMMLALCGCDSGANATAIRMTQMQNMANVAERALTGYDDRIAIAEEAISTIQVILSDPNLAVPAREEMRAAIAKAVAVKAKFEGAKVIALEQIRSIRETMADLTADGVQPGEDLIAFGEGITNVGRVLPPPVGPILALIGGLIGAIGEARRRTATKARDRAETLRDTALEGEAIYAADANEFEKVARGVVASVKTALKLTTPDTAAKIKLILKDEQQDLGVRAGVKKLLDT